MVGFVQLFSDKMAATVKSTESKGCSVHAISFHASARGGEWLIDNGYVLVGSLPACCSDEHLEEKGGGQDEEMSPYGFTCLITLELESTVRTHADTVRERTTEECTLRIFESASWNSVRM